MAFIDNKRVYVKGSELGYSLAKVEKILLLTREQKRFIITKPDSDEPLQKPGSHLKQIEEKFLSKELLHDLKPGHNNILSDFLKPVDTDSLFYSSSAQ